jgi:PIN domain nuclease of toxin-antitoxin system
LDLLLDTHIFLWWDCDLARLPIGVEELIADRANSIAVSAISVFELAMKRERGHLSFIGSIEALIYRHGFDLLPVEARHAEVAAALPSLPRDPFDRLLIAQAKVEKLQLITDEKLVKLYPSLVELRS